MLLGPLAIAWASAIGPPTAAVVLLAERQWALGALVAVAGGAIAAAAGRALLGLARRWLVFVPAGIVVHDPFGLADPVLFPRHDIAGLGPAVKDGDDALDLTANALGLALELRLREPATVLAITRPGRRPEAAPVGVERLLMTPTRAAAVLAAAADRRYPVS